MKITKFGTISSNTDGILLENFFLEEIRPEEEVTWITFTQAVVDYQRDHFKGPDLLVMPREEYERSIIY